MKVYNFSPGPAALPREVIRIAAQEMTDFRGCGCSIMEISHRSSVYREVHEQAVTLIRELLQLPENYHVLLLGGGATLQFSMLPLNFLREQAAYVLTGSWSRKAMLEAEKHGKILVPFDGANENYVRIPDSLDTSAIDDGFETGKLDYLHITSNETINGLQWSDFPQLRCCPLLADMSSDILSRKFSVTDFSCIYAAAQKNLGPAGLTVVILRDDFLDRQVNGALLPSYLNYRMHADTQSLYNTPPVFSVYMLALSLEWIQKLGGITAMEEASRRKSELIYSVVDQHPTLYFSPVERASRSAMNIVFFLPNDEQNKRFLEEAGKEGFLGLQGHRSVGGCRVSLYNFVLWESVEALADFMSYFAENNV